MQRYFALSLALLFIALGDPSNAQEGAEGAEAVVSVREGAPLLLECPLRVEQRAEWRRDGGPLPPELRAAPDRAAPPAQLVARLSAPAARPHLAGLYTCARPPAHRVRLVVLPAETTEAASAAPSAEPAEAATAGIALAPFHYDVARPFTLNCTLGGAAGGGATNFVWKKNGTALEQVAALAKRYSLEEGGALLRMVGRSTEDDYGNYTCALADRRMGWEVRATPHAKLPHNFNVVEKQTLKVTCKVIGKPYPAVSWTFTNETQNGTDVVSLLGERVTLRRSEQGVEGGELVLSAAERSDAGEYTCWPAGGVPATTVLRVKDQFAALWPFLGICAEVFVLCAIILVYEKRRTKPELDDSDTDNHDQKKS